MENINSNPGGSNNNGYTKDVMKGLDRNRPVLNNHPTVKPVALMRYLIRLVTPPGGAVLDMFAGTGSTCVAAKREGFRFIGIEINKHYRKVAKRRVAAVVEK